MRHPFRERWNHNSHHYPRLRDAVPATARVLAPGGLLQVLGAGRFGGPRDVPAEVRDVLTHQVLSRRTVPWEPPTTRLAPASTWDDARSAARDALPGSTYRRVALWRYLVSWTKPVPV